MSSHVPTSGDAVAARLPSLLPPPRAPSIRPKLDLSRMGQQPSQSSVQPSVDISSRAARQMSLRNAITSAGVGATPLSPTSPLGNTVKLVTPTVTAAVSLSSSPSSSLSPTAAASIPPSASVSRAFAASAPTLNVSAVVDGAAAVAPSALASPSMFSLSRRTPSNVGASSPAAAALVTASTAATAATASANSAAVMGSAAGGMISLTRRVPSLSNTGGATSVLEPVSNAATAPLSMAAPARTISLTRRTAPPITDAADSSAPSAGPTAADAPAMPVAFSLTRRTASNSTAAPAGVVVATSDASGGSATVPSASPASSTSVLAPAPMRMISLTRRTSSQSTAPDVGAPSTASTTTVATSSTGTFASIASATDISLQRPSSATKESSSSSFGTSGINPTPVRTISLSRRPSGSGAVPATAAAAVDILSSASLSTTPTSSGPTVSPALAPSASAPVRMISVTRRSSGNTTPSPSTAPASAPITMTASTVAASNVPLASTRTISITRKSGNGDAATITPTATVSAAVVTAAVSAPVRTVSLTRRPSADGTSTTTAVAPAATPVTTMMTTAASASSQSTAISLTAMSAPAQSRMISLTRKSSNSMASTAPAPISAATNANGAPVSSSVPNSGNVAMVNNQLPVPPLLASLPSPSVQSSASSSPLTSPAPVEAVAPAAPAGPDAIRAQALEAAEKRRARRAAEVEQNMKRQAEEARLEATKTSEDTARADALRVAAAAATEKLTSEKAALDVQALSLKETQDKTIADKLAADQQQRQLDEEKRLAADAHSRVLQEAQHKAAADQLPRESVEQNAPTISTELKFKVEIDSKNLVATSAATTNALDAASSISTVLPSASATITPDISTPIKMRVPLGRVPPVVPASTKTSAPLTIAAITTTAVATDAESHSQSGFVVPNTVASVSLESSSSTTSATLVANVTATSATSSELLIVASDSVRLNSAQTRQIARRIEHEALCRGIIESEASAQATAASGLLRHSNVFTAALAEAKRTRRTAQNSYEEIQRDFVEALADEQHPLTLEEEEAIQALVEEARLQAARANARHAALENTQSAVRARAEPEATILVQPSAADLVAPLQKGDTALAPARTALVSTPVEQFVSIAPTANLSKSISVTSNNGSVDNSEMLSTLPLLLSAPLQAVANTAHTDLVSHLLDTAANSTAHEQPSNDAENSVTNIDTATATFSSLAVPGVTSSSSPTSILSVNHGAPRSSAPGSFVPFTREHVHLQMNAKRQSLHVHSAYSIEAERARQAAERVFQQQAAQKQREAELVLQREHASLAERTAYEESISQRKYKIVQETARVQADQLRARSAESEVAASASRQRPSLHLQAPRFASGDGDSTAELTELSTAADDLVECASAQTIASAATDAAATIAAPPARTTTSVDDEFFASGFTARFVTPPKPKRHSRFSFQSDLLHRHLEASIFKLNELEEDD